MSVFDDLEEDVLFETSEPNNLDPAPFYCAGDRSASPTCCGVSTFAPRSIFAKDPNLYPTFVKGLHARMHIANNGRTVYSAYYQERYRKEFGGWKLENPDGTFSAKPCRPVESFPQNGTFVVEMEGYTDDEAFEN